ncbi:zonular occludens toxin family protein [Neisseria shayeganii]|uniref:DUF2075 domain-containing protein n=1 Tax=Neisseria shayeganii TaxID=607712 RepID=A0A7D7N6K0_9NEIS|nr:zonular occludens toxin domain-containing protein [Neisseria shayeganii]QMT40883.1 DUF2075 domain-containing protein [Neisseria shayeganii]
MAEVVLITGTPGSGKTLKLVSMMAKDPMFQPDENGISRKVFTNIKGLKLSHIPVSSKLKEQSASTDEKLSFHDVYDWIEKPENHGSILIIDEAQDVWPARSPGAKVPPNVEWLNTHRHLGVDIFVLTQNPKYLDLNLRGLVKKHWHIAANKLGMRTLLEWKYCANNPITQAKDAFASIYKLDDSVYDLYDSAEVHTENKTKRSKWVYVLPLALVLAPIFLFVSYKMLKQNYSADREVPGLEQAASDPAAAGVPDTVGSYANGGNLTPEMFVPTLAEKPESKPIYNGVRQVKAFERVAACIDGGKSGCACYTDQATKIREIPEALCREYAHEGLPFDPYREQRQTADSRPAEAPPEERPQILALDGQPRQNIAYSNDAPVLAQ